MLWATSRAAMATSEHAIAKTHDQNELACQIIMIAVIKAMTQRPTVVLL